MNTPQPRRRNNMIVPGAPRKQRQVVNMRQVRTGGDGNIENRQCLYRRLCFDGMPSNDGVPPAPEKSAA